MEQNGWMIYVCMVGGGGSGAPAQSSWCTAVRKADVFATALLSLVRSALQRASRQQVPVSMLLKSVYHEMLLQTRAADCQLVCV